MVGRERRVSRVPSRRRSRMQAREVLAFYRKFRAVQERPVLLLSCADETIHTKAEVGCWVEAARSDRSFESQLQSPRKIGRSSSANSSGMSKYGAW